jgi:glycosyltransferase involved in cell wall biosynthesis
MWFILVGVPGTSADSSLRVLVLASTFPARPGDGTPEFVLALSAGLAARGADVTVLVPRVPGAAAAEVIDGISVLRFRYFFARWENIADGAIMPNLRANRWRLLQVPAFMLAFLVAAFRARRRVRPDVVHAHWVIPAGLVALALNRVGGSRYIVTAHGADAFTLQSGLSLRLKRQIVRRAKQTLPVSMAIGNELRPLGPVGAPIPMGVDMARIRREVGQRHPEPGRILFVGRLVDKKGVDVLLHALAALPHARLAVVGDGPCQDELKSLSASLGLDDRVEFLGKSPREEVMRQFARAAVIALPSHVGAGGDQDGVPVVLAEAVAAGVPVVASALGGLGDYVRDGDTGRSVPPGDATALAAALGDLLDDPARAAALAERAAAQLSETLGIDRIADDYIACLRSAATG